MDPDFVVDYISKPLLKDLHLLYIYKYHVIFSFYRGQLCLGQVWDELNFPAGFLG